MTKDFKFSKVNQSSDVETGSTLSPIQDEIDEITLSPYKPFEVADSPSGSETCIASTQIFFKRNWITIVMITTTAIVILLICLMTLSTRETDTDNYAPTSFSAYHVAAKNGAVASDEGTCSSMGVEILKKGGNAVDAAVTTALCVGLVSPMSSGVGGGCYIVIHNSTNGDNVFIDSREFAPALATPTMFEKDPLAAQNGGMAIAVLAEMKGLYLAWQRHGGKVLDWKDLVLPVAELAEEWVISPMLSDNLENNGKTELLSGKYPELSKLYLKKDGTLKTTGDKVKQPAFAKTLRAVAEQGPSYIYDTMAATLASEIAAAGGIVSEADIRRYEPTVYPALESTFMGKYRYVGAGGSSSGGSVVAGILNYFTSIAEPLVSSGAVYHHRLVEAMKHGFAMRLNLGDPLYANTTEVFDALLNTDYMKALQESTSDAAVLPLLSYGGKYNMKYYATKDSGTTHLSVVDKHGNAVALTSTVNTYFGSKVVSPSTGILFNNQMDDFSIPGASNYFGLAPSPFNYPEPYKRPLSSMSPSIILEGSAPHKVRLTGGASGGPKIITATLQVILNTLGFGMDPLSALTAPRVHSQLLPDEVQVEDSSLTVLGTYPAPITISAGDEVYRALTSRGHLNVSRHTGGMACTQFITIDRDTGLMHAVSDPRKDGRPAGY